MAKTAVIPLRNVCFFILSQKIKHTLTKKNLYPEMLKITYTETGFNLEHLADSLEQLVVRRIILAMRVGQSVLVEPSKASFLLPADLPLLNLLHAEALRYDREKIELSVADENYIEVTLQGTWIAANSHTAEGLFLTAMSERTELYLFKCWEQAKSRVSLI